MKIADGIEILEISVNLTGRPNTIYPVLLRDEKNVLIDAGYPGQTCLNKICAELEALRLSAGDIGEVIITHQDMDHIGGLPGLRELNPRLKVCSHSLEVPYIEGEKKLIKTARGPEHNLDNLPENVRKAFLEVFSNPPKSKVDITFEDGQELPLCGGIKVIHTLGHTPGHICLYLAAHKLLISGDALVAGSGVLYGPMPEFAQDLALAYKSLEKLLALDIEKIVCYHGGLAVCGAERIKEIIGEHNKN